MVAISDGPDAIKQAAIRRNNPVEEGLTGGTQTQVGRITNLVIEVESLVDEREKVGF